MLSIMLIARYLEAMDPYFTYWWLSDIRVFNVLKVMCALEVYLPGIDDIFLVKEEATYTSFIAHSFQ